MNIVNEGRGLRAFENTIIDVKDTLIPIIMEKENRDEQNKIVKGKGIQPRMRAAEKRVHKHKHGKGVALIQGLLSKVKQYA